MIGLELTGAPARPARPCTCTRGTSPKIPSFHCCPAHGWTGKLDPEHLDWCLRKYPQRQVEILAAARAQGVEPTPVANVGARADLPTVAPRPCECGSFLSVFDIFPVSRRAALRCNVCDALQIVELPARP